jgi:hypothetical protein
MADPSVPVVDEKAQVVNEKPVAGSETETTSAASPTFRAEREDDLLDEAFKYLHDHTDAESAGIDVAALRRRIDWRIVPIMFACYVLQFVDKVVINVSSSLQSGCRRCSEALSNNVTSQYAAVMGINKDLALTNNDFTNVGSAFFIAYLIAEVPNGKSASSNLAC